MKKAFVEVIVKYKENGRQIPLQIKWKNDICYEIDRVLEITKAASMKVGGIGIRYKCRIRGKETFLWLEGNKWFVEQK